MWIKLSIEGWFNFHRRVLRHSGKNFIFYYLVMVWTVNCIYYPMDVWKIMPSKVTSNSRFFVAPSTVSAIQASFRSCNSLKLCNECSIFHLQKFFMLGLCNMNFDFFSVSSVHKCPQICVNIFMITLFYLQLHWIYMREWLPEVMPAQMKQTFYAQNKWSKDYSSNCRSLSN